MDKIYIARDKNGILYAYLGAEPTRNDSYRSWELPKDLSVSHYLKINSLLFPDLTYEDDPLCFSLTESGSISKGNDCLFVSSKTTQSQLDSFLSETDWVVFSFRMGVINLCRTDKWEIKKLSFGTVLTKVGSNLQFG